MTTQATTVFVAVIEYDQRLTRLPEVAAVATTLDAAHRAAAEHLATLSGLDDETDDYLVGNPLTSDILDDPTRVDAWLTAWVTSGSPVGVIFDAKPLLDE